MKRHFAVLILGVLFNTALLAESYTEGVDYIKLDQRSHYLKRSAHAEVLEFFWYGCVHCYHLDQRLKNWADQAQDKVKLRQVPAIMKKSWVAHAKAFYASKSLGIDNKVHTPLFAAIHDKKLPIHTPGALSDFIAVKANLDPLEIEQSMESLATKGRIIEDVQLQKIFNIRGAPSIVINRKYMTNGHLAKNINRLLKITDFLVNKETQP